jgi:hypothetical protein
MDDGYWTYKEWLEHTVAKIVAVAMAVREEDRAGWLDVQIRAAIAQALRHGRAGGSDDDPVS